MLKFFVKRPVTTVMFVLFWVVLGVTSWPKMNIESSPSIDFPMVTATFIYPGASPSEIETQVLERAEDAMSEVSGLKKITSYAYENSGFVMAEFNLGVDVNDKANEVKAKIETLTNDFPEDLKKPIVEKLNPLQESVVDIVISGADSRDGMRFAKDVLSQQITSLPGVASVSVFGGESRAVRISLDPERMAARGISILDVVSTVGAHNLNVPGGKLELGRDANQVRFIGEFKSIDDIANLGLATPEGSSFRLRDIATITDGALDRDTGARYNGQDVVILSVTKAGDGNAIKISNLLRKNMPDFERLMNEYFSNPANILSDKTDVRPLMEIVSDSSISVQDETNSTFWGIVLGLALTALTLLVFTRNWRSTIIASVVIPASLLAGFFFMQFSGFTINGMTLLAMATALGTLVSNAIVLIESSLGQIAHGYNPEDAAIQGTKNVAVAILASAGTNIVVFLPIAFMGGIAGQFMQQFGLSVVYLTILSLMFSFTLTPMMIAKILKKKSKKQSAKPVNLSWYRRFFDFQIKKPLAVVIGAVVILMGSAVLLKWVGNEFVPSMDADEISITARAPMGSSFAKSEQLGRDIEARLLKFKEVSAVSIKTGERGVENISIKLTLVPRNARTSSDKEIAQALIPALSDLPDAEIQIKAGRSMSSGIMSDMTLQVRGSNDALREKYADKIIEILNEIPEIQSAVLSAQKPADEYRFIPNDAKMKYWGVANRTAAAALRTALYGNDSFKYKEDGKEYPILINISKDFKTKAMYENIYVNTMKGLVPLSELGNVTPGVAASNIVRIDKNRVTEININIGKSTMGPVQQKIEAALSKIDFAPGYGAVFAGMSDMQDESTSEIASAFILAVVLTFMLLAAIMNSMIHPFTVAASIIFSFAGVFIFLFLSGASINIAALLSIVMLVGLAVNNNILLLEPAIAEIAKGVVVEKALWNQFIDKTRTVLMMTIAVAAGMIPQLWSADGAKVSMGAVIIGGMLASLFWTYAMTPALFILMERLRGILNKKRPSA